jgi:hypothetical protein
MRVRNITTCALGLAAALSFGSSVSAQDTTRLRRPSDQRITVSKGEVVTPPRVDTVYVTRYDTVRVNNTIVRVDTVTVATPAPVVLPVARGAYYFGLFGGLTNPIDNVDDVYKKGGHVGALFGWDPTNGLLGFRTTANLSRMVRETALGDQGPPVNPTNVGSDRPWMLQLTGDGKINAFGGRSWGLYGIAGLNWNMYKNLVTVSDIDQGSPPDDTCDFQGPDDDSCFQNAKDSWSHKFGWNFGGGLDFGFGGTKLFVETRFMAIQANDERTWTIPISLGIRF